MLSAKHTMTEIVFGMPYRRSWRAQKGGPRAVAQLTFTKPGNITVDVAVLITEPSGAFTAMVNEEQALITLDDANAVLQNFTGNDTGFQVINKTLMVGDRSFPLSALQDIDERRYIINFFLSRFPEHQSGSVRSSFGSDGSKKSVTKPVTFSNPFSRTPHVNVSLNYVDSSTEFYTRINVNAENVGIDGFDLVFKT
ncbi:hypothetical protein BJ742DRAFT_870743 [Cladochytrium replicatum]|nr:hypothetical protein BJ742DRAFT_870743 [Cladochytrium replicatum]